MDRHIDQLTEKEANVHIRLSNGSITDAAGIIEVDLETFDDCPYSPGYIASLQETGATIAWIAEVNHGVVGFVSAFETHSLAASRWEIDELAVRPSAQGHGLGTQLVAAAVAGSPRGHHLDQARAVVAQDNAASGHTFARNGFQIEATVDLLLYQVSGRVPRPKALGPSIRLGTAPEVAQLSGQRLSRVAQLAQCTDNLYLVAIEGEQLVGCAELVRVRTFQYQGYWIESIALATQHRDAVRALFAAAIEHAKATPGIDRLGYLAQRDDDIVYTTCVSQGFHCIDTYQVFTRRLVP
jgi:ribosomal protein S18 acetylase RimI-like enzyme